MPSYNRANPGAGLPAGATNVNDVLKHGTLDATRHPRAAMAAPISPNIPRFRKGGAIKKPTGKSGGKGRK